jgi:hypothetical protein
VADSAQSRRFLGLQVAVDVVIADPDARMTLWMSSFDTGLSRRCLPDAGIISGEAQMISGLT